MRRFLHISLASAVLFLATVASAHAQSTDPEIQRLQSEKERAQLEAEIAKAAKDKAEAEAAALKAYLGSLSTANLPQGTVKADSVVIEGSYLAYMAANSAAQVIADRVPCGANIVFLSAKDLDGVQALDALKAQIPLVSGDAPSQVKPLVLRRVSASVLPEPSGDLLELYNFESMAVPVAGPAAGLAAVDTGLSLIALFKTDTEFRGVTVTADDLALQALVAQRWRVRCPHRKVVHPGYSYPRLTTELAKNDLLKEISTLSKNLGAVSFMYQNLTERVQGPVGKAVEGLRKLVADHHDAMELIKQLRAKLKATTSGKEKKQIKSELDGTTRRLAELNETARSRYDTAANRPPPGKVYSNADLQVFLESYLTDQLRADVRVQALKALQTKMSEFVAALTKPDTSGVTPLVSLLKAQALRDAKGADAGLLHVGFVTAGGNNIIKRNIVHSSLRFSGGVIAKYLLADDAGYITASGVVACYGGQLKEHEIGDSFAKRKGAMACSEGGP